MKEIYSYRHYMKELKQHVKNGTYTFTQLPTHLRIMKYHIKSVRNGYIIRINIDRPAIWRVKM